SGPACGGSRRRLPQQREGDRRRGRAQRVGPAGRGSGAGAPRPQVPRRSAHCVVSGAPVAQGGPDTGSRPVPGPPSVSRWWPTAGTTFGDPAHIRIRRSLLHGRSRTRVSGIFAGQGIGAGGLGWCGRGSGPDLTRTPGVRNVYPRRPVQGGTDTDPVAGPGTGGGPVRAGTQVPGSAPQITPHG